MAVDVVTGVALAGDVSGTSRSSLTCGALGSGAGSEGAAEVAVPSTAVVGSLAAGDPSEPHPANNKITNAAKQSKKGKVRTPQQSIITAIIRRRRSLCRLFMEIVC